MTHEKRVKFFKKEAKKNNETYIDYEHSILRKHFWVTFIDKNNNEVTRTYERRQIK